MYAFPLLLPQQNRAAATAYRSTNFCTCSCRSAGMCPYHQCQAVGTLRSFETSVTPYQSTRRNNLDNLNLQQHSAETDVVVTAPSGSADGGLCKRKDSASCLLRHVG